MMKICLLFMLSKLFNISKKSFIKSLKSFNGLPIEIFLRKKIVYLLMTQKPLPLTQQNVP